MSRTTKVERLESLICASLSAGENTSCGSCRVLKERSRDRGVMMRVTDVDGTSVIVKAWKMQNLRERVKSRLRLSMAHREWRMHRLLKQAGLAVPQLLHYGRLRCDRSRRFEVVVMEDLGEVTPGVLHLKRMVEMENDVSISQFEQTVIDTTERLLKLGVIDVDNQLNNYVVTAHGGVVRIDFECAQRYLFFRLIRPRYVAMLDRLFRSHLHATYPQSDRSLDFIARLLKLLRTTPHVCSGMAAISRSKLMQEYDRQGVRYEINWAAITK